MGETALRLLVWLNRFVLPRLMTRRLVALVLYQDVLRPLYPAVPAVSLRMVLGLEEPPWGRSAPPRPASAGLWER